MKKDYYELDGEKLSKEEYHQKMESLGIYYGIPDDIRAELELINNKNRLLELNYKIDEMVKSLLAKNPKLRCETMEFIARKYYEEHDKDFYNNVFDEATHRMFEAAYIDNDVKIMELLYLLFYGMD